MKLLLDVGDVLETREGGAMGKNGRKRETENDPKRELNRQSSMTSRRLQALFTDH